MNGSINIIPPIVVYHIAGMGNWRDVIRDQFFKLRQCGLSQALKDIGDSVRVTYVGTFLDAVIQEAAMQDVPITIVRSDGNTDHYETFAMIEIERLAKVENVSRPILYFHTKGVSNPGDINKYWWRLTMEHYVLDKWKENLQILKERDAVGFNWWTSRPEHFSGTFWVANADWIRMLPDFVTFHHSHNLVRFSCELWIGSSSQKRCNAHSYGCMDQNVWRGELNWNTVLPQRSTPAVSITFLSAATISYISDLSRLQESIRNLCDGMHSGFSLLTKVIDNEEWKRYNKNCAKLQIMDQLLRIVDTDYVLWIDADCEFTCRLCPEDLVSSDKDYICVRHLAFDDPRTIIPIDLHKFLPSKIHNIYWQSCLFGGKKSALEDLLRKMEWVHKEKTGYDEWAVNVELQKVYDKVHTLPCRYAAPSTFKGMPQYEQMYNDRSEGAARILHHNREINR